MTKPEFFAAGAAFEARVEQFHDNGIAEIAIFRGPMNRTRAKQYVDWLNQVEKTS